KRAEGLKELELAKLNHLFNHYPELQRALLLKEYFREWYRGRDRHKAEEVLSLVENRIINDSLPEFKKLLSIFNNWRKEILNYFIYPLTNGFVEGKHNRIKTIKRMAYGYRNPNNFKLRILATNPGFQVGGFHTY
ncbi:transposase, partial [Candidatus Hakubella thermalkaliphila]